MAYEDFLDNLIRRHFDDALRPTGPRNAHRPKSNVFMDKPNTTKQTPPKPIITKQENITMSNNFQQDTDILALQMLGGIKLYKVNVQFDKEHRHYSFKSAKTYQKGDKVLVNVGSDHAYRIGEVVDEALLDAAMTNVEKWRWIIGSAEEHDASRQHFENLDKQLLAKMQQARTIKLAKEMLQASGLTIEDLKGFLSGQQTGNSLIEATVTTDITASTKEG